MNKDGGKDGRNRPTPEQLSLQFPAQAADFETLIRTPCNAQAVDRLKQWQSWPNYWLAIVGPSRSGLSTLASAFRAEAGVELLRAADLNGLAEEGIDELARAGVAIDEAEAVQAGHVLLAILNRALEFERPVALFSHSMPATWTLEPGDLRSRLRFMSAVEIGPPDEEMIAARLELALKRHYRYLPVEVGAYLARRLPADYEAVEDFIAHLETRLAAEERPIGLKVAREALAEWPRTGDLFGSNETQDQD